MSCQWNDTTVQSGMSLMARLPEGAFFAFHLSCECNNWWVVPPYLTECERVCLCWSIYAVSMSKKMPSFKVNFQQLKCHISEANNLNILIQLSHIQKNKFLGKVIERSDPNNADLRICLQWGCLSFTWYQLFIAITHLTMLC